MDLNEIFDRRYLHFYDLPPERAVCDVDVILEMALVNASSTALEIGSGEGRILRELARRGFRPCGIDTSRWMIEEASRRAGATGLTLELQEWDIRVGPVPASFDLAISWFTSFGFFEDGDCRRILEHIRRSLKNGGVFVMDLVNKDYLLPKLKDVIVVERENEVMVDRLRFDSTTGRLHTTRTYYGHKIGGGTVEFFVRLFAFPEIRDWLIQAGFNRVELRSRNEKTSDPPARLHLAAHA